MELALLNQSRLSLLDLEFQRRALETQMVEHFVPAWTTEKWRALGLDFKLPESEQPWPYAVYTDPTVLPVGAFFPLYYRSEVPDGELGDHDPMQAQVLASTNPLDATTPSHEGLETRGDPPCDLWIPSGIDGVRLAAEAGDPVEDTSYPITVTGVQGQPPRDILVSNFILPAWFVRGSAGPWDYLGVLAGPQEITPGGYVIQDDHGAVADIFGGARGRAALDRKRETPFSRAARRTTKLQAALEGRDWRELHAEKYGPKASVA